MDAPKNGSHNPGDSQDDPQRIELFSTGPEADPEGDFDVGPVFGALVQFLTEEDWSFNLLEGDDMLTLGFQGESGSWRCLASVDEDRGWATFYSVLPTNAPPDKRLLIAEYIARANFGATLGNFEMDFSDGEIRYKTSIDVEGGELTTKMAENLIYANVLAMDRFFPGFMAVLYGNKSPLEALEELGGQEHECDDDCEHE